MDTAFSPQMMDSNQDVEDYTYPGMGEVLVSLLDFGNRVRVQNGNLRKILTRFLWLPFQALECGLFNLQPYGFGLNAGTWSKEASRRLHQLTENKTLVAKVCIVGDSNIQVKLYIPDQEIEIGDKLIQEGLAVRPPAVNYMKNKNRNYFTLCLQYFIMIFTI